MTLMAVVLSPDVRVAVAESLNPDFSRVSEWCNLLGMKLNASKIKALVDARSRTMHPQSPPLTIGGTVLKEAVDLDILGDIKVNRILTSLDLKAKLTRLGDG